MFGPEDEDWEYTKKHDLTDEELEEYLKYLREHPLFMKDVPEDISHNPNFEALQNLAFSDTPENIARSCNERGNGLYKKGPAILYYMREALKCYEDGIEAGGKEGDVNAKLYSNRALINFNLSMIFGFYGGRVGIYGYKFDGFFFLGLWFMIKIK